MLLLGLPPPHRSPTLVETFISAGLGGSFAEIISFPLDTAKVRLQIQGEGSANPSDLKYRGVVGTCRTVLAEEGVRGLYGGMIGGLHRQMIHCAMRVGLFYNLTTFYQELFSADRRKSPSMTAKIAAGITTGALGICFAQPCDVVKVRMQAQGAEMAKGSMPRYTGTMQAYWNISQLEGFRGLWKGILPNMIRNSLVNCAEMVSYETIKANLVAKKLLEDKLPCHLISAVGAAFVTTIVCSPIDVVKTRFMNSSESQYKGVMDCTAQMWNEKGLAAFYKGCVPLFARVCCWNALMFVSFEQFKRLIMLTTFPSIKSQ